MFEVKMSKDEVFNILSREHKAFETGSRVFNVSNGESDFDLVVLIQEENSLEVVKEILNLEGKLTRAQGYKSVTSFKVETIEREVVDILVTREREVYSAWFEATRLMKEFPRWLARDKDVRVELFEIIKEAYLQKLGLNVIEPKEVMPF